MLEFAFPAGELPKAAPAGVVRPSWHARRTAYAIEAASLGIFMFVAGSVAVTLAPGHVSPAFASHPLLRRFTFGVAMGLTVIAIVYSPWGRRSGAHLNPALTLTYAFLGKIAPGDAAFYVLAQFAGGALGLALAAVLGGMTFAQPSVHYIVTKPGPAGAVGAFAGELAIAFALMSVVLVVSNSARFAKLTGICAGLLVTLFITFEAPLSGMSMNPARTFASALAAHDWTAIWVYFTAPPLGMGLAALVYVKSRGVRAVRCAKLYHTNDVPCIFRCGYREVEEKTHA
ncbi:MAG: MIP/aquaporin family protein [Vulcanimicrobiaceae bacterium]